MFRNKTKWLQMLVVCTVLGLPALVAQTPTDAIMMDRGQLCVAAIYGQDAWDEYWEGIYKRSNGNLGTVTRKSVTGMFSLGITDRINVLGSLPWIKTSSSAGYFHGVQGIQDWGVWIKGRAVDFKLGPGSLGFYPVLGLTGPASNYLPDYLPFSLGLGAVEGSGRGILIYEFDMGLFVRAHAAYHVRSHTTIERDYYYTPTTGGVYSNKVDMPNASSYGATLGAILFNEKLKVEATYDGMNTIGGPDIRLHDMPFPSSNMDMTRASLSLQYYFPLGNGHILSVIAGGSQVLTGRNVGQSTVFMGGLTYQFGVFGKKDTSATN